jgi:dTMP kinase
MQPDVTILMDSDVAPSIERARRRNRKHPSKNGAPEADENRFEQESRAFFGRVRNAYLAIAVREPERVVVVDARGSPDETQKKIVDIVRRRLKAVASK